LPRDDSHAASRGAAWRCAAARAALWRAAKTEGYAAQGCAVGYADPGCAIGYAAARARGTREKMDYVAIASRLRVQASDTASEASQDL